MSHPNPAARKVFYDSTNIIIGGCRQFGATSISEFFFCVNPTDYQLSHRDTGDYVK